MKKRALSIVCISMLSLFALTAATISTVAWFSSLTNVSFGSKDNQKVRAGMETFPYARGTGTEQDPYILNRRTHLYNLAWKQYLGHYNVPSVQRCYFRLEADIDMKDITLPPIGTDTYPFYGFFDGGDCVISNLTITNDDPTKEGTTEFGIARPANTVINASGGQPSEIVGFFGVVGNMPGQTVSYNNHAPSVESVTLENLKIKSGTTETLVGLAAGYIDGTMSDVKVGSSEIDIDGCKPISSITPNLSDYSLVGYCATTNTISDFTKTVSEKTHKEQSGGQDGGFGASVNFRDYTNWFWDLHENKGYDTGTGTRDIGFMVNYSFNNSKRYNKLEKDDFSLMMNTNANYPMDPNYDYSITYQTADSRFNPYSSDYYSGTFGIHYTSGNNFEGEFVEATASSSETTSYAFTGTNENGTKSYNGRHKITFTSSKPSWIPATVYLTGSSASTVYIYSNSGYSTKVIAQGWYFRDSVIYHLVDDNYLPLRFDDEKTATNSLNTGYIVGANLTNNLYGVGSPRIASYASTYLNNSLTNGVISSIKTYDLAANNGAGGWVTLSETTDDQGAVTGVSNVSFMSGKYASARNSVGSIVNNQSKIHGIHFDVSASNTYATGYYKGSIYQGAYIEKKALLKSYGGTAKTTRFPKGSIDFELEDSGYITFFAGMYNTNSSVVNLNFFSLFHVDRTNATSYTLREIKKVYKSTTWTEDNPTYVYWYDGQNEPASKGDLVFDIQTALWPARSKDNTMYYFEIPVNQGEYCMGAVNQSHTSDVAYQGAYMMYLDIGSNGKSLGNNAMDAFYTETTSESDTYPNGVDFNIAGLSTVGGNTGCMAIQYDAVGDIAVDGTVTFTVAAVVAIDSEVEDCYVNYKANNTVLNVSGSTETIGDITDSSGDGRRIIMATITTAAGVGWTIEYQEKLDGSGGTYTKIFEGNTDHTSQGASAVPEIFTSNLANIKAAAMAVQLDFTGTDFTITSAAYAGTSIALTIPTSELGSTVLQVTFGTNYSSLSINGSPYPAS